MDQLKAWRKDRTLAHVVPFAVFMIFMLLYQFVGEAMLWEHDLRSMVSSLAGAVILSPANDCHFGSC